MMTCPHCKKGMERVRVFSQCVQDGTLSPETGRVIDWSPEVTVLETLSVECPHCAEALAEPEGGW